MKLKVSPLAPKSFPEIPAISGVRLAAVEAGIKYAGRTDLTAIVFDRPASVAGVFTKSKCPSAPVDWCKSILANGTAGCAVINSGNANAFTGMKGRQAAEATAKTAAKVFSCDPGQVYLASTGVIGEPLDVSAFQTHLGRAKQELVEDGWQAAAKAIMTTDTYPKMATAEFGVPGRKYRLNGIAKGSGMIAPDMATMLAFLVTDLPIANDVLQRCLDKSVGGSFNSITVDSDTSTSDTVLLFSATGDEDRVVSSRDRRLAGFRHALQTVMHDLAMQIVRDGEGATKHVGVEVSGAVSAKSAKRIAMSIANSPLVKTAIAGEDANWGRIVMAVGKAGEPADRDRLAIYFGGICVARNGERSPDYSESETSKIMQRDEIEIQVDIGLGRGTAKVWTCDLTREYVAINGDYRS